jgi:uncharacterized membrane protein YphA (DoxX/SURF4 family)
MGVRSRQSPPARRATGRAATAVAIAVAAAAALAASARPATAHQRWFHPDQGRALEPASMADPGSLAAVAAALLATSALYAVWRLSGRRSLVPGLRQLGADVERQAVLLGLLPLVMGLHTAIPLVVSGIQLQLFAPNLSVAAPGPVRLQSPFAAVVALGQIGIGLALFYGAFTRAAALLLASLWLLGAAVFGPFLLLEQALFLGAAAFFFIAGRGAFSVDAALGRPFRPLVGPSPYAVPALRVGTGVGLAAVALGEKLWNVPYAVDFLREYPVNVLAPLGLPVSDRLFVLLVGAIELTAGLVLITGAFVREAIIVLWLPFNLTLPLFGWRELVGHLAIYGAMAVLLVWGTGTPAEAAALKRGLAQRPSLEPPGPTADRR